MAANPLRALVASENQFSQLKVCKNQKYTIPVIIPCALCLLINYTMHTPMQDTQASFAFTSFTNNISSSTTEKGGH